MPPAKRKRARPRSSPRRGSKFVCPECGFKAAHAMGLGRHRTSRHGVPSQRQLAGRASGGNRRHDAKLVARVAELEKRYDKLVKALRRAL